MEKTLLKNKFLIVTVVCLTLALSFSDAFAWGHGGRYYWHGGRWYAPGWFGLGVAVSALTIGAIVVGLPRGSTTVVVGGTPYYYYDRYYYRPCPGGYVVVPPPAPVVAVPAPSSGETVTINVPNANGSYTPVTLVRQGDGYVGPQGEYYAGHPTVDQLKALYGR